VSQIRPESKILQGEEFSGVAPSRLLLDSESVFRYCNFENFSTEGDHVDSTFLGCTFRKTDWYWAHFNLTLVSKCVFENCVFRGVTFSDVRFVECSFKGCVFTKDNLDGDCRFDGSRFFDCSWTDNVGTLMHT
jgi:uncharacterized protein YjbI with pentapeptide repeats